MASPNMMRSVFTRGAEPTIQPGNWAALPLRIVAGLIFIYYGADKLFLNSVNTGMDANFFRAIGIPFPELNVVMIGMLEFFGGLALLGGLLTKLFAFFQMMNMLVALITSGNYILEGPLFLMAMALILFGGGPLSLDAILGRMRLPNWLGRLFRANASPTLGAASWGSTPLRLGAGLVFLGYGLSNTFGSSAGTTDVIVGVLELLGGLAILAGVGTKPFALLLALIAAGILATRIAPAAFNIQTYIQEATLFCVLGMALAIVIAGAGPVSVDYVLGAAGRNHTEPDRDPVISYSR
jgi:putative oxidoreductase